MIIISRDFNKTERKKGSFSVKSHLLRVPRRNVPLQSDLPELMESEVLKLE